MIIKHIALKMVKFSSRICQKAVTITIKLTAAAYVINGYIQPAVISKKYIKLDLTLWNSLVFHTLFKEIAYRKTIHMADAYSPSQLKHNKFYNECK